MPASHPLRSTRGESAQQPQATSPSAPAKFRLLRGCVGMKDQPALRFSLRSEAGRRFCCRYGRQHILCVRFARSSLHTFILFALAPPACGTLQRGIKSRTIWRCLPYRCFPVTLTAPRRENIPTAARSCPCRVAVTAPARRHPSRQRNRSAGFGFWAGAATPKAPAHSRCLTPSIPKRSSLRFGFARCAR